MSRGVQMFELSGMQLLMIAAAIVGGAIGAAIILCVERTLNRSPEFDDEGWEVN